MRGGLPPRSDWGSEDTNGSALIRVRELKCGHYLLSLSSSPILMPHIRKPSEMPRFMALSTLSGNRAATIVPLEIIRSSMSFARRLRVWLRQTAARRARMRDAL